MGPSTIFPCDELIKIVPCAMSAARYFSYTHIRGIAPTGKTLSVSSIKKAVTVSITGGISLCVTLIVLDQKLAWPPSSGKCDQERT